MAYDYYRAVLEVSPDYVPGEPVRAVDDDSLGRVEFARSDGWVCVVWQTGRREWVPTSQLAPWRGVMWEA